MGYQLLPLHRLLLAGGEEGRLRLATPPVRWGLGWAAMELGELRKRYRGDTEVGPGDTAGTPGGHGDTRGSWQRGEPPGWPQGPGNPPSPPLSQGNLARSRFPALSPRVGDTSRRSLMLGDTPIP